jgi:hypothetical protein
VKSPLRFEFAEQMLGADHIHQQKMDAGEDIVLVIGSQILELAEVA